ncbi:MAG: T9SS type A sorting domain-containing protein [Bacteroidetes bacterium]|nr:T9SS type A sorting domain-containing protein [Bacteroidota bacterium]
MRGTINILLVLAIFYSEKAQSQAISLISGSYSSASATGSTSTGNASLTYTAPAGSNRMLIFVMSVERDHKPLPNGDNWANPAVLGGSTPVISFGGTNLTLVGWSISYWANAPVSETTTNMSIELLVYAMPEASIPSGSNTFTIASNYNNPTNAGDESIYAAMVFDNVNSASNITYSACGTCTSISTSAVDPLSAGNALVALSAAGSNRTYTQGAGYTLIGSTTTANASGTYTSASISEKDGNALGSQFITGTASTQTSPFTISGDSKTFGVTEMILRLVTSTALPVTLIDFSAEKKNENVLVKWSTGAEINNDYFTIERSVNGENFEAIATINGKGNSNNASEYQFIDEHAPKGTVYYKLKQTDYDGTTVSFDMEAVNMGKEKSVSSLFPNPCSECSYIDIRGESKNVKQIYITDNLGNNVLDEVLVSYAPGSTMRINFSNPLAPGMYMVKVNNGNDWTANKLVVK